jgi:hypothetical protein
MHAMDGWEVHESLHTSGLLRLPRALQRRPFAMGRVQYEWDKEETLYCKKAMKSEWALGKSDTVVKIQIGSA